MNRFMSGKHRAVTPVNAVSGVTSIRASTSTADKKEKDFPGSVYQVWRED
jgi:hypothetical protein